jgi:hypothetical protein
MGPQEAIGLVIGLSQVAIMTGVFFKLGSLTEALKALGRRVETLENKG